MAVAEIESEFKTFIIMALHPNDHSTFFREKWQKTKFFSQTNHVGREDARVEEGCVSRVNNQLRPNQKKKHILFFSRCVKTRVKSSQAYFSTWLFNESTKNESHHKSKYFEKNIRNPLKKVIRITNLNLSIEKGFMIQIFSKHESLF